MRVDLVLESPIEKTGRVTQLAGMFDVPVGEKTRVEYHFDASMEERPWKVGLVVGPSGAGKSSVARALFGEDVVEGYDWPASRAIVDGFGSLGIRDITAALSSVGFSSPPNWLRPFGVLSNGERFRANMARALVDTRQRVVVDEFTSVVDRQVAQIGSHAIQKTVRQKEGKQFVAVTCHYDVEDWLQPDWVIEPHLGRFTWRSVQPRPQVELTVCRAKTSAWQLFKHHHYLTADLNPSATCFVGFVGDEPAVFDAWLPFFGRLKTSQRARRGHRTVCLPDYQGLGLGNALFTLCASMWKGLGLRAFSCTGHPAELHKRARSPDWRMTREPGFTAKDSSKGGQAISASRAFARRTASFEYVGAGMDEKRAKALMEAWC